MKTIGADNQKIDFIVAILNNLQNLHLNWIQRKEISAWSAIILFLTIQWVLFNFINSTYDNFAMIGQIIFSVLFVFIFFAVLSIFFFFIQSQYSSIYYSLAYIEVLKDMVVNLISENHISTVSIYKKFITLISSEKVKNRVEEYLKNKQRYRGKYHPIKILLDFWKIVFKYLYSFTYEILITQKITGEKYKRSENDEVMSDNCIKQEAAIYSLLFIITFVNFLYFVIKLYSCFSVELWISQ
jgi:hypothetical protein